MVCVMRLAIVNRWLPWARRWRVDRGDMIDVGTPAVPAACGAGLVVVDAGADFVEVRGFDDPA